MAAKLMHAVQYKSFGGGPSGLKHVEIPIPTLKKDEVLLKLEAASLNPGSLVDWATEVYNGVRRIDLTDVAGEMVEVGQGVKKFKVGDKVVALLSYSFAAAKEKSVVAWPLEVSADEGSSLPVVGLSAHQALTKDAGIKLDRTGELKNVLITGAAGGLGNTHVTATCGARNIELVKSLGADEVLDYMTPEGVALKSPSATDVAGEVVEVGQGAKKFKFGDKVVLLCHFSGRLAEFAATNERLMVARPPEVSAAEGACLPVAGLTAPQTLTQCARVKLDGTGQNKEHIDHCCLWWRGALCSPTSKAWDTNVTATCGACNIELVKSLGADEVLEYRNVDGAALKSPSGRKYDFNLTFSKKQLVPLLMIPKDVNLEYLVKLVKEGKLKPVIDSMHPLSKAEDAWLKSIDGHATGNIILEL
ncbi:quinone-oxidoreductase-like protein [Pyrus ussuriensis x Pyrus communis]|uniref:Quinone-oxidoreductase-like protein n=1 Tax=Pyrus ussuriensis x Pyrus communis TaxID=2448454 RepID=A0A5N5GU69_9ROSA|nr:quinone-oxidoreductase-like protein [Pyrus ussuriensis x Pyrus communis]